MTTTQNGGTGRERLARGSWLSSTGRISAIGSDRKRRCRELTIPPAKADFLPNL